MHAVQNSPDARPDVPAGLTLDQPPVARRPAPFVSQTTLFAALLGAGVVGLAWLLMGNGSSSVPRQVFPDSGGTIQVNYTTITAHGTESGEVRNVRAIEFHPACVVVRDKKGDGTVFFPQHTRSLTWSNYGGN